MSKLFVKVNISIDEINEVFLPNENITESEWNDLRFGVGEDWSSSVTAFIIRDMKRQLDELRNNDINHQLNNPWLDIEIKEQKIQSMIEGEM